MFEDKTEGKMLVTKNDDNIDYMSVTLPTTTNQIQNYSSTQLGWCYDELGTGGGWNLEGTQKKPGSNLCGIGKKTEEVKSDLEKESLEGTMKELKVKLKEQQSATGMKPE